MSENTQEDQNLEVADRVIFQEEVRLYNVVTVVAYLTGPIYDFTEAKINIYKNPVPVFTEDGIQLGFGMPYAKDDKIVSSLSIDYACEERLLIETKAEKLYARFYGRVTVPAMLLFDFQAPIKVTALTIDGIVLTRMKPSDDRLVPVGQLVTI